MEVTPSFTQEPPAPSASAGNVSVDQKMPDRVGAQCWTLVTEHTPLPPAATVSIGCKPATYLTFLGPGLLSRRRAKITQRPGGNVGYVAWKRDSRLHSQTKPLQIPTLLLPSWWTLGKSCALSRCPFPRLCTNHHNGAYRGNEIIHLVHIKLTCVRATNGSHDKYFNSLEFMS